MGRFLAGVASALLLAAAGMFFWQGAGAEQAALPEAPPVEADRAFTLADIPRAPAASERSKEEKRFDRYDKDKNGAISQSEYLENRRKGYDRLDVNRDGVLSFAEYAQKTAVKFTAADRDKSGSLNRTEFASTRVVRKPKPKPKADCPPSRPLVAKPVPGGDEGGDDDAA